MYPKDPNPDSEEGGEKVIHKGGEVLYDGENLIVVSRISDLEDDTNKATVFLDRGADGNFEDIALVDFGKNYGQEERTNYKYSNLLSKLAKVMEDPEGINPLSLGAVAGISNIDKDLSLTDLEWVSGNSERVRNALGMDSDRPDHQEYKHKILRQAGITDEEINQLTEAYFQVTEQANNALKQASK